MRFIWYILALAFVSPAFGDWQITDASILVPLPAPQNVTRLLGTDPLIPRDFLAHLPNLLSSRDHDGTYRSLKVIGLRIDPCFREGEPSLARCHKQIRLIWQPLREADGRVFTADAALHSFYELDDARFAEFTELYQSFLKTHPHAGAGFVNENLNADGEAWADLKALLLRFCDATTLTRLTVMTLGFNENQWDFRGYNVIEGKLELMRIPVIQQTYQSISMAELENPNFGLTIMPSRYDDRALTFFSDSANFPRDNDLKSFLGDELRLEDPARHNSGTTDCVSCHLENGLREWTARNFTAWDFVSLPNQNLIPAHPASTSRLRAFGYFGAEPVYSARFLRENESVIHYLNGLSF